MSTDDTTQTDDIEDLELDPTMSADVKGGMTGAEKAAAIAAGTFVPPPPPPARPKPAGGAAAAPSVPKKSG